MTSTSLCHDERIVGELADLFTKVVSRSAGKARFLFVCASERLQRARRARAAHRLAVPAVQPLRADADQGTGGERRSSIACCRCRASPPIRRSPKRSCSGLDNGQGLLAADLQIAAMAMRDLRITNMAALQKLGGPTELESAWLHDACRATGNERSALRLCAELADGPHGARTGRRDHPPHEPRRGLRAVGVRRARVSAA